MQAMRGVRTEINYETGKKQKYVIETQSDFVCTERRTEDF